jgi:hypothetical protein
LVELFRAREIEPLLILDDSDTWIARPHDEHPAQLAEAFFARNVRMLATEIDCGFIVAVHPTYLELAAYKEVAPRLERISVPHLSRPGPDLARILSRRLEVAELDFELGEVFDLESLAVLASAYEDQPDVRQTIAHAATSVRLALEEAEFDRVTPAAVRAAIAERSGDDT